MSALTATSPVENSSAFSLAPPAQGQAQIPQAGGGQISSALMQGLNNYLKAGMNAAGNPNATTPSLGSSLIQPIGGAFDKSPVGQVANFAGGNAPGNGYGSQLAQNMSAASSAPASAESPAVGAAADGAATDGAAAAGTDAAASSGASDGALAALSVICTALYSHGMISRNTWLCAQRYGRSMASDTFSGYLLWASPIACRICASPKFARISAIIFVPIICEMAFVMKEPLAKSTLHGRLALAFGRTLSFIVGKMLRLRGAFYGVSTKA